MRFKNMEQEQHGQERCARHTGEQGSPETEGEKEFDFCSLGSNLGLAPEINVAVLSQKKTKNSHELHQMHN